MVEVCTRLGWNTSTVGVTTYGGLEKHTMRTPRLINTWSNVHKHTAAREGSTVGGRWEAEGRVMQVFRVGSAVTYVNPELVLTSGLQFASMGLLSRSLFNSGCQKFSMSTASVSRLPSIIYL
jgi:hypothetical protein